MYTKQQQQQQQQNITVTNIKKKSEIKIVLDKIRLDF
jgi:hypothetical protein